MSKTQLPFLLAGVLLAAGGARAAETVISDAETLTYWEGGTLIDEAKVGAHAVRFTSAGKVGGLGLGLHRNTVDFTKGGELKFWYRFSGTGSAGLMFKLQNFPFADGVQAVWDVLPAQKADGEWHQLTVDLKSPFQKWGGPDTNAKYLFFRVAPTNDAPLTLDIDQVTFTDAPPPAAAAPLTAPVILSDGETTANWDAGTSLIDDAKVGAHAVRFALPANGVAAPTLNIKRPGLDVPQNAELSFWYRFSGTGTSNLMVKVQAFPFADGAQAVWEVLPRQAADGQWHHIALNLGTPYMKWTNATDTVSRYIAFRTDSGAGSKLTLDLDDVQIRPVLYTAKILRGLVSGNSLKVELELANQGKDELALNAEGAKVTLAGGETRRQSLSVPLNTATPAKLAPLESATQIIHVGPGTDPATAKELRVAVVPPLTLPATPRLMLTAAEIPAIKARIAANPPLQALSTKMMGVADGYLAKKLELPNRGGQWGHWYACKKDGARLQTVSPTEHKCPVCGTIYTGWPYDDVPLANIHVGYARAIQYLGVAYRLTGDKKYADRAREILLAYSEKYLTYPEHDINGKPGPNGGRIGAQKLDEAVWLISVVQGADMVWDTLSDADRDAIEFKLLRPATDEIRSQKLGIHNIQNWQNSAVGLTGLLLNDPEMVAFAISGEFGFRNQIAQGITDDGQWFEGSWGYHFYAMNAMMPLLEAGERCGLNLYRYEAKGHSYKTLFEAPIQLAMPNFELPAFNDSGQVNLLKESNIWEGGQGSLYELALTRYKDPQFAEILRRLPRGSTEAMLAGTYPLPQANDAVSKSQVYPKAGYTVLKQGEGANASWLCLKYGPHGGGHGHFDKLNFVLYSHGKVLGLDPGTASYGVPIQEEWYRTTLAHNTLVVDETNQKPAAGSSLAFLDQPGISAALADAGPIYDGVQYRRAVALFGNDVVLVVDIATSNSDHTYDFAYHNSGKWSTLPPGDTMAPPVKPGYQHLKGMVKTTGPLPAIANGDVSVKTALASLQTPEIWAGDGVGTAVTDRVPCIIARVRGQKAVVAWIMNFGAGQPEVQVTQDGAGYQVTGTADGKTYKLAVSPGAQVKLAAE